MKSSSASSFRNKASNIVNIPGTKVSVTNAQLLTSTGSSTLDFFLGGGLAIGTICAIEEDQYNSYASLLMKYFLAEGVTRKHSLFLAGGDIDPKDFLKELPAAKNIEISSNAKPDFNGLHDAMNKTQSLGAEMPTNESVSFCSETKPKFDEQFDPVKLALRLETQSLESPVSKSSSDTKSEDSLKIAWRYKSQSVEDAIKAESHNMSFDLTKKMPYEEIEKCSVSTWIPTDFMSGELNTDFLEMSYLDLLHRIKRDIESQGLKTSAKNAETILRVGINSISSPLWRTDNSEMDDQNLLRFLFALKALLRTSFGVAVITIPSFLSSNYILINRIRQICDTAITLEAFMSSAKMSNPLIKDFDGLLHIKKLPVLNTFTYPTITEDLAFKLRKRGLIIERLHLPPELGDPTPEQQEQFCCGSLGNKLDF